MAALLYERAGLKYVWAHRMNGEPVGVWDTEIPLV